MKPKTISWEDASDEWDASEDRAEYSVTDKTDRADRVDAYMDKRGYEYDPKTLTYNLIEGL